MKEAVLSAMRSNSETMRDQPSPATRGDIQMTAFIATVSILGAGIAALISMGLGPEVALAVLAII